MTQGRKPGYKHDNETKNKISQKLTGSVKKDTHKENISQSMKGRSKSESHRDAMSKGHLDMERKCTRRFLEMRSEYPGQEEFFDSNRKELLIAMRDIKSESELRDIRRYIETRTIEDLPQAYLEYQYDSSSIYAHQEAMCDLIDAANDLRKALGSCTKAKNILLH
jgi:hypothetical protein